MVDLDKAMAVLREEYSEWCAELPSHTRNVRDAALFAWCLTYDTEDYGTLPYFWQRVVSVLLNGLILHRTFLRMGTLTRSRSDEVDEFCVGYLEKLWELRGRKAVFLASRGCWGYFGFEQCYDCLWTVWDNLKELVEEGGCFNGN